MTNIFKPYPTHFSRGGRTILRSPWLRVCLCILRKCCYIHNAIVVQRSCHFDLWRTGHLAYFGSRRAIFAFGSKNVGSRRVASSGVAIPEIWVGSKMFDFRRITLFCLDKRLAKQKMTIFSKNLGGPWPLWPPWLRLWCSASMPSHKCSNSRVLTT